jgi:hypothetical protein
MRGDLVCHLNAQFSTMHASVAALLDGILDRTSARWEVGEETQQPSSPGMWRALLGAPASLQFTLLW